MRRNLGSDAHVVFISVLKAALVSLNASMGLAAAAITAKMASIAGLLGASLPTISPKSAKNSQAEYLTIYEFSIQLLFLSTMFFAFAFRTEN
jgi:hypothetical protein